MSHAAVAVVLGRSITLIPNQEGQPRTPCVVTRTAEGEWLVGELARRQAMLAAHPPARSFKRLLGKVDPIAVGEASYPPQQLAALVLRKLRLAAEAYLGQRITRAVITVPACFDDCQIQGVLDAASIAGFDSQWEMNYPATGTRCTLRPRIVREPTAAALAFGLTSVWRRESRVAILHLGSGSFDVSVLNIGDGVFCTEAVGGDESLGGEEFDSILVDHLSQDLAKRQGFDPRREPAAWLRLREAVEQARIDLSGAPQASICLPFFCQTPAGVVNFETVLTRTQLLKLTAGVVQRCRNLIQLTLAEARLRPRDVENVFLVGGMMRTPHMQELARGLFNRSVIRTLHADDVVAGGAAILGHELPRSRFSDLLLVDVAPLEYGAESPTGQSVVVIKRNTVIPAERTVMLTLPVGRNVPIRIFQGTDRRRLGELVLEHVKDGGDGKGEVNLSFEMDQTGALDVHARDALRATLAQARIFPSSGLSPADVERLRREAEQEQILRGLRL
jgi:molecular chaperone DnaK